MLKNAELFYREIKINSAIVREEIAQKTDNGLESLTKACRAVIQLSNIARKEGLLSLEEAACEGKMDDLFMVEDLKKIVLLVVDGTDPDAINDICMKTYFSKDYSGVNALVFLLYMDGMIQIQAGENPRVLEESIRCYMPDEVNVQLDKLKEDDEARKASENKTAWEQMFDRDFPLKNQAIYDYTVKLVDYCIAVMPAEDLMKLIKDFEMHDLAVLLKGLSGKTVKRIYDCLSEKDAADISEMSKYLCLVRCIEIDKKADRLFKKMVRLADMNEITVPDGLDKIFDVRGTNDGLQRTSDQETRIDLGIKKWFLGMTNRDIQRVLNEIPRDTLSIAMKNWDMELKRLIYGNLPKPVAGIVAENTRYVECSESSIEKANRDVEEIIRKLEDSAEIIIME